VFFFFSSRRRHTRFKCDWSSDVCSSDLSDRVRNPIDAFILAKLESLHLDPSPEAAKTTLVRRVYLDLIGLPPTPEEAAAFLADRSEERRVGKECRAEG